MADDCAYLLALRADRIQPGDILLSRGRGASSKAIKFFSGGRFSPAAICTGTIKVLESSGLDVVGYSRLRIVGSTEIDGVSVSLRVAPREPVEIELFRHPDLSGFPPDKFDEALFQEIDASYGKDYSEMIRLAAAAPDDWKRPFASDAGGWLFDAVNQLTPP